MCLLRARLEAAPPQDLPRLWCRPLDLPDLRHRLGRGIRPQETVRPTRARPSRAREGLRRPLGMGAAGPRPRGRQPHASRFGDRTNEEPRRRRSPNPGDPSERPESPCTALEGSDVLIIALDRDRPAQPPQCNNCFTATDSTRVPHYHAWLRSGRIFTMTSREFNNRTVAHKWAATKRKNPRDRLILSCETCPPAMRSKRRPPRWGAIIRAAAARLGIDPGTLRAALVVSIPDRVFRDQGATEPGDTTTENLPPKSPANPRQIPTATDGAASPITPATSAQSATSATRRRRRALVHPGGPG